MTVTYDAPPNGFRTFLILWASQAVSVFGTALTLFAVNIWLVQVVYPLPEQKSELAWSLAALGMVSGLAAIAATPIAGALVCLLQLFNPGLMRLDDKEYMDRLGAVATGA